MARLTAAQTAALARAAGFPEAQVPTAVAVAMAETGGSLDTDAIGDVILETAKWGPSVGLWQVRSLKPAYLAKAAGADRYRDEGRLRDPGYNAAAARAIWGERGWSPWSTYPTAHLIWLPQAKRAAGLPAAATPRAAAGSTTTATAQPVNWLGDAAGAVKDVVPYAVPWLGVVDSADDMLGAAKAATNLLGNLLSFIAKAAVWLGDAHNWLRIAKVWAGSWLVVLGLAMFGWPAITAAAQFVPAGKAATAAAGAARAGKAPQAAATAAAKAAPAPKAPAAPRTAPRPAQGPRKVGTAHA